MEEAALVDRVFLRIVSTDTDEQFQASLQKFIAPVLLKLASPSEDVRKKVMELLVHINKRLKSRPQITLPLDQLLDQYNNPENPSMVTNFSIIYIKMGFPRLPDTEQVALVPTIINLLPKKPQSQQEILIALIVPVLQRVTLPSDPAKKKELFSLEGHPTARSFLLNYMLDVLLLPYSPYFPPPDGPAVAATPQCPPCFSEQSYKRLLGVAYPSADQIETMKAGVLVYVTSDILPSSEVIVHLIIASSDSRHTIATSGENELRRVSSDIDWEDNSLVNKMALIYLGTTNQVKKDKTPASSKGQLVLPAPTRIKAKLFPLLLKSKAAAQLFPQNIQIACDGLAGPGTNNKLKRFAIQFIANMAEFCPQSQLKAISPTLLNFLWKIVDSTESSTLDIKPMTYQTIGKLVNQVPSLVFDKVDVMSNMFSRLTKETDGQIKSAIQESLMLMSSSLSKARHDVKDLMEKLLSTSIESAEDSVRRVSVYLAHHVFHTSWLPTRYLLLLACSDQLADIRSEASKFLHSKRSIELPVAEHSFELDLYPTFDEISAYIHQEREKRLRDKKTYTRGNSILAFKPETLQQIVYYLRTCLAWSCGVKDPHVMEVSDWMTQAPKVALYQPSDRKAGQAKQQRMSPSDDDFVSQSISQYCQLLVQHIEIQATTANVYLLLEIVSLFPSLSKELSSKIGWFKGLVNHHDQRVQSYAADLLSVLVFESDSQPVDTVMSYLDNYKPSMNIAQQTGSIYAMSSLIAYAYQSGKSADGNWSDITLKVVKILESMLHDNSKLQVALQALSLISTKAPLSLSYGSDQTVGGEISAKSIVDLLCEKVKSSKLDSKVREKVAECLGTMGLSDPSFPWRQICINGLFDSSTTKELELHFTVGNALATCAQGLDSSDRRSKWRQSESDYWESHTITGPNEMPYLVKSLLDKHVRHVNPHIKQAACVWLLTLIKRCHKFPEVIGKSSDIQEAFMKLLTENDEITQDIASKGLGLVYDNCNEEQQKELISNLVDTLMTGKSAKKKSGEVSEEAKLFTEGGLGSSPEGQGMSTYRELCAIATDLNQPDLIYKFLHLANHQSMWNSRKGAAFGFSTIAAQAGEQLAPYMSQIVPRLYRYTFDPNIKIQTAMRSIWNAVVKETKPTVDKYAKSIMEDLLENLTNNQWRIRESCCLAVNDLLRGRPLDDIIDSLPRLWSILFRLLDDIKESTRLAATNAAKTLSKQTIKICDVNYGKVGEKALSLILPVLLTEGITSNVSEVRSLSLETIVSMSKNAGTFLKPHIHTLVPVMLESLTGLEPQYLNYVALRVSGQEEVQQKLDKARVAAFKMSPMMDSINLCIRQVDKTVLPELVPRLIDVIKNSIGLGTKVGVSTVVSSLCTQCHIDELQPFAGKLMAALLHGLSDRNATVRKSYATTLSYVCKLAKATSVEKLMERIHQWYMEKEDDTLHDSCGLILQAMVRNCPDTLAEHKTRALPLVFLAMHRIDKHATDKSSENIWKDIWSEVTVGTESAVKFYMNEFVAITDTALQSSSWHMKAQAAAAMATIATSAGSNIEVKSLSQLIASLLNGLSGRTWNGKEVLLKALSDVLTTSSETLKTSPPGIDTQQIVDCCLKEARKESLNYKVSAVKCLAQVIQSLEVDYFTELYDIVSSFIVMDKYPDEEISDKLMIEFREIAFEAIGKAWPQTKYLKTQGQHIASVSSVLLSRLASVTWKEQLAIWTSLYLILERTPFMKKEFEASNWSTEEFTNQLVTAAVQLAGESKYSSIREATCKSLLKLVELYKSSDRQLPDQFQSLLRDYVTTSGTADSSLEVKKLCEKIKAHI